MHKHSIEKLVNDAINSFDDAKRAEPKPFLFARVMASLNNRSSEQNVWTRLGAFISRPSIAIAGIILIMLMNASILFASKKNADRSEILQNNSLVKDEFATTAVSIYDIENPEQ